MQNAERAILVLDAQAGGKTAWRKLVETHHKGLIGFATKLCRDPETARDIVQDVWLTAAKTLRTLRDPSLFKPWLYKMLRYRVVDYFRKTRRYQQDDRDVNEIADGSRAVDEVPVSDLWHRAGLNELDTQSLHLFYMEGLKVTEIASVMDVAAGTIKSRLFRARERLKKLLEKENEDR